VFTDDGMVAGDTERGRVTILSFDLNRSPLIEARRAAAERALVEYVQVQSTRAMDDAEPYAAAQRQSIRRHVQATEEGTATGDDDYVEIAQVKMTKRSIEHEDAAQATQTAVQDQQAAYSLASEETTEGYYATARLISRIVIENFRPIERLELDFSSTGWLVLLGENGAGKSSVLSAVALALMGQDARDALGLDARKYVRRTGRSKPTSGKVEVTLSGISEPVTLTFSTASPQFGGTPDPKVLLLGYGSTRLLPRRPPATPAAPSIAEFDNLFDPFAPLTDAAGWLLTLPDDQFTAAARGLRSLLDLGPKELLSRHRKEGEVRCNTLGATVPIGELSDGYQSVLALATDIMNVLFSKWTDLAAAEGVVILDELGAHLHPRWQMRIVSRLRALFPQVQFLATTHDPLTLRGLNDGEVAVISRLGEEDDHRVVVETDLPPIAGMRADQLLTSEFFGLNSTIDPDVEAKFDEYFALKALRTRSPAQRNRMRVLGAELEPLRVLGQTPRERLAFEAAELFLQEHRKTTDPTAARSLKASAREELAGIWAQATKPKPKKKAPTKRRAGRS
jgi:energy-coupling factor transporter ATP-binding protein EcfA2